MNTKQCVKCKYWKTGTGECGTKKSFKFCHFLLATGMRRERNGDECMSRMVKK